MPYSTVTYAANGTDTDFLITWNYLDTDHIRVKVGGVLTTDVGSTHQFSLVDSTTVRVTDLSSNPVALGVAVELLRETPITSRAVTFAEGSALRTADLNKNSDFLLYSMQEAIDTIDTAAQEGAALAQAGAEASKVAAEAAQGAAEAALDLFNDQYLGSLAADPTVDNDGDPLVSGAVYWNNTAGDLRVYNGSSWEPLTTDVVAASTGGTFGGDVAVTGNITATSFIGDGSALTGIEGVPSGIIAMWGGLTASIPTGWSLCDGTNGTPDLRDRFIIGSGSTYTTGDTGGNSSVTLTESNLPAHSHNGSGLSTNTTGAHTHTYSKRTGLLVGQAANTLTTTVTTTNTTANTSSSGAHSHTITGSTGSTGSGTAVDITPPYYALAYIQKD